MASAAKRGRNEPPQVQPIIVKKVIEEGHGAHHGGAWKIAYADFVTAMMAFFLLLWIIGATDEDKKRGLADYFTPTLIEYRQDSAGSDGILGGDSIIAAENYPHKASQTGSRAIVIPRDVTGGIREDPVRNKHTEERIPAGRWGTPEDLQGPVVFLASDAAAYLHGVILPVDGGWLVR